MVGILLQVPITNWWLSCNRHRNPQNPQPSQRYCLWSTDLPSSKDGLPPQLSHSSLTRAASLRMPSTMWEHTWQKKPHTECTGKEEVVFGSWHPVTYTENWLVKLVFIKSAIQCKHWSKKQNESKIRQIQHINVKKTTNSALENCQQF